jgi:riboflavin transporter FmnP
MAETSSSSRVEDTTSNKNAHSTIIKIVGGAIFGAISLVISLVSEGFFPSLPWGLAFFDPVSIVWILSFFIFGYEAGILSSVIGAVLLFVTDDFAAYLGPLFKFCATIPLIIVPFIIEKIRKHPLTSEYSLKAKNLIVNWLFAVLVRIILMIGLNVLAIIVLFKGFDISSVTLSFIGLDSINGWTAFVISVILLNILQSVSDYLIPSALVKPIQAGIPNLIPW